MAAAVDDTAVASAVAVPVAAVVSGDVAVEAEGDGFAEGSTSAPETESGDVLPVALGLSVEIFLSLTAFRLGDRVRSCDDELQGKNTSK